jgi:hypothetical protein
MYEYPVMLSKKKSKNATHCMISFIAHFKKTEIIDMEKTNGCQI